MHQLSQSSVQDTSPLSDKQRAETAEARVKELETAIRTHWEQKADDRCWEDDSKLYSVVPLPDTTARCIGDPEVMLENCKRFIKQRTCAGGPWKSYAELEAENAKLREQIRHANEIAELREQLANNVQVVRGPTTLPDGRWAIYCPVETRLGGQLIIDSLIAFRLPDREEK